MQNSYFGQNVTYTVFALRRGYDVFIIGHYTKKPIFIPFLQSCKSLTVPPLLSSLSACVITDIGSTLEILKLLVVSLNRSLDTLSCSETDKLVYALDKAQLFTQAQGNTSRKQVHVMNTPLHPTFIYTYRMF